jgi:hypothetical protein
MIEDNTSTGNIRTALFVDFDNIYSGLRRQDAAIADIFASNPAQWLTWLEGLSGSFGEGMSLKRKILIRKCYLNPREYSGYRPYFIRSAFEVMDCPPLTAQGKTSTDIHLVMDVLDALSHPVRFDEFIIFSADADFTPLLLKLRMNDRLTTILCAGYASPAYKASCDLIISIDEFIRDALGIESAEEEAETQISPDEISEMIKPLLKQMADRIFEEASEPAGIQASELPSIYRQFPEFAQSTHWLGFNTLRKLTEAAVAQLEDLVFIEEDPWCVARRESVESESIKLHAAVDTIEIYQDIKAEISSCINDVVSASSSPVKMAYLAHVIRKRFSDHLADSKWLGAGTFKDLLKALDLGRLRLSSIATGFVYDPVHHKQLLIMDNFSAKYPEIAPLAKKIHELTDTPLLAPENYRLLFQEIAREVNESGFSLTRTSKTVRDRCVEKGAPISRANVNFILIGLMNWGYRIKPKEENAETLREAFTLRTISVCRSVQLELDAAEVEMVKKWIAGSEKKVK